MATIATIVLDNGLPLHRIEIEGSRVLTLLVAFDAGARTERAAENGMAHFLEHLVFRGGERYSTYRDIYTAADGNGAVLDAYTNHDLVAFHITVRSVGALAAADLLTDIVARPRLDPAEVDCERGVVIQEINRAGDRPAAVAEQLIDKAVFGDHPLGRSVLGTIEHVGRTFTTEGMQGFRARRWAPSRGAAFAVGNLESLPDDAALNELFSRLPAFPTPAPFEPAPRLHQRVLVTERDSNQSQLRMSYRPQIDVTDPRQRAALIVYSTLLGGSTASRLVAEIRERQGLADSIRSYAHAYADVPALQLSAGLDSRNLLEAYRQMRQIVTDLRARGPTEAEVERARAYAAGDRAIAFENTYAVARKGAQQAVMFRQEIDPDLAIERVHSVTVEDVVDVARGIEDRLAVACVGPHTVQDLESF